jgi:hypothetical protein
MTVTVTPAITTGWTADKKYTVAYSPASGLITGLYGSISGFNDINHVNMPTTHTAEVGCVSQEIYNTIGEGIISPHALAFYKNGEIKIRKIVIDLGPGTYIDGKLNAIVALNNTATIKVSCVDANSVLWNDIQTVDIKNLAKRDVPISFNGTPSSSYKAKFPNNSTVTVALQDEGRVAVQVKVVVPELTDLWLAIYPEFYGLDEDKLKELSTWAAKNGPSGNFGG